MKITIALLKAMLVFGLFINFIKTGFVSISLLQLPKWLIVVYECVT
jgi:hypothetical protein